jgi:hypothetical protein
VPGKLREQNHQLHSLALQPARSLRTVSRFLSDTSTRLSSSAPSSTLWRMLLPLSTPSPLPSTSRPKKR